MSLETFSVAAKFSSDIQKFGNLFRCVFVFSMYSDTERAPDLPA